MAKCNQLTPLPFKGLTVIHHRASCRAYRQIHGGNQLSRSPGSRKSIHCVSLGCHTSRCLQRSACWTC